MDYIETVRRRLGHDLVITVGCGAVIEDPAGRILLQRRRAEDRWAVPGGLIEPGEFVAEAMRREVLEETGLDVEPQGLFGVYSGPEGYAEYPNGDRVFSVMLIMRARTQQTEARPEGEEFRAQRFFARAEFPDLELVWSHQRRILTDWLSGAEGPFLR